MVRRFPIAMLFMLTIIHLSAVAEEQTEQTEIASYKTPQACYDAMVEASKKEDKVRLLFCFAEADRNQQVGWIAYQVERQIFFQTEKQAAAKKLLEENGLKNMDIMGAMQIYNMRREGVEKALEIAGSKVQAKVQFIKAANELLKADQEDAEKTSKTKPQEEPKLELSDVIIEKDQATGKIKIEGQPKTVPMFFVKEDGSWRITTELPVDED